MPTPVVLGMDFGGSKIAVAVSDTAGTRLATVTVPVRAYDSARRTFERGIDAARDLLTEAAPDRSLVAVGACTFGIPREDGIDLAPTITGWGELPFGVELRAAFPDTAIRMATDVKAAARAEAEHGALAGHDPGLYVNLGTGLAVAVVIGGAVVAGRHGAAGEIGYNLRSVAAGPKAPRLEQAVSGKALLAASVDGDVAALFERADTDPGAARVCAEFLAELCFQLVNLTIAVDPSRVAFGGGLVRSWDRLHPALAEALRTGVPFPPEVVRAAHPFDAPLIGALALATAAARDTLTSCDDSRAESPAAIRDACSAVISEGAPA